MGGCWTDVWSDKWYRPCLSLMCFTTMFHSVVLFLLNFTEADLTFRNMHPFQWQLDKLWPLDTSTEQPWPQSMCLKFSWASAQFIACPLPTLHPWATSHHQHAFCRCGLDLSFLECHKNGLSHYFFFSWVWLLVSIMIWRPTDACLISSLLFFMVDEWSMVWNDHNLYQMSSVVPIFCQHE